MRRKIIRIIQNLFQFQEKDGINRFFLRIAIKDLKIKISNLPKKKILIYKFNIKYVYLKILNIYFFNSNNHNLKNFYESLKILNYHYVYVFCYQSIITPTIYYSIPFVMNKLNNNKLINCGTLEIFYCHYFYFVTTNCDYHLK